MQPGNLERWCAAVRLCKPCVRHGRLVGATGSVWIARLPGAVLGERVAVGEGTREAEVVGFRDGCAVLLPGAGGDSCRAQGCGAAPVAGAPVVASGLAWTVPWSEDLCGRVVDPLLQPIDGRPPPPSLGRLALDAPAPDPLRRRAVDRPLATGVRALDGLVTLGRGQRLGLFAGPGVGKSTLLAQVARNTEADRVVLCLVGERGREVQAFVHDELGPRGLERAVVVSATSDAPAFMRVRALPAATALAEGFRRQGHAVLLLVDSLTRHARALREIALAAGEPPGRRGFPPSVFDRLAAVVERAGCDRHGSITALYTVLVEGQREDDPVAGEVQSLLDGHLVLDPRLAAAGCFPALDPASSLSRLMDGLVSAEHRDAARRVRALWSAFEERRDLIAAGAYEPGTEPVTDRAVALRPRILEFLSQPAADRAAFDRTVDDLCALAAEDGR